MLTTEQVISLLHPKPHPFEGGYFVETYRARDEIPDKCLPRGYAGARSFGTAIYYLLTPGSFSALLRLRTDEVFHYCVGDPVETLQLSQMPGDGHRRGGRVLRPRRPKPIMRVHGAASARFRGGLSRQVTSVSARVRGCVSP